jgi:DNA-binding GntR family transcriptional regulator
MPTAEPAARIPLDALPPASTLLRTLGEQVHRYLYEALLAGTLAPGDRLREAELAERFSVSRTPIRAVLRQLEQDGLVVNQPHRGATVRSFTRAEAKELYELRAVLESAAAVLVVQRSDEQATSDLLRLAKTGAVAAKGGSLLQASVDNDAFHVAMVRASGNSMLFGHWQQVWGQIMFLRARSWREHPLRARAVAEEHEQICRALLAADPDEIRRAVSFHAERAWKNVETALELEQV